MKNFLMLIIGTLASFLSIGQCAWYYEDNYAAKFCQHPDSVLRFNSTIEAVSGTRFAIHKFTWWDIEEYLGGVEDVIYANLNCSADSLFLETTTLHIVPANAYLQYSGSGVLFSDSIRINFSSVTPDGPQSFCYVYLKGVTIGVDEYNEPKFQLSLWPNPTNSIVHIDLPDSRIEEVKVFNQQGQMCFQDNSDARQVDLTAYPSGLYFVVCLLTDNVVLKEKVIKY